VLERELPGGLADARRDADACFEGDLPAALGFDFGEAEARRIAAPALVVLGRESAALHPRFRETYDLLLRWLPAAEGAIVAGATHFLQLERPHDVAELLAGFYARQPLGHV
jgi:pimeloyl-ACP methyl ester carboxylesterase